MTFLKSQDFILLKTKGLETFSTSVYSCCFSENWASIYSLYTLLVLKDSWIWICLGRYTRMYPGIPSLGRDDFNFGKLSSVCVCVSHWTSKCSLGRESSCSYTTSVISWALERTVAQGMHMLSPLKQQSIKVSLTIYHRLLTVTTSVVVTKWVFLYSRGLWFTCIDN